MKIKIVEPGNESFTGHLGNVQFFGGVSTHDVSEAAASGIAAIYRIERIEAKEEVKTETVKTEDEGKELTSEEQKEGETTSEGKEVTSEEQKTEEAEKTETTETADAAKE